MTRPHLATVLLALATACLMLALLPLALLAAPLQVASPTPTPTPTPLPTPLPTPPPTPAMDRWAQIREWSPYPYTRPLPPAARTPIDGVYVRFDPRPGQRTPCRRCPAYPPEGGVWKVQFNRGVFYVYHPRTGWRTLGSYTVDGDTLTIFNDPQCHLATGTYRWTLTPRQLQFELIADDCELGTRPKAFATQPWASCQPPSVEAAVTGHWPAPEGCEDKTTAPSS